MKTTKQVLSQLYVNEQKSVREIGLLIGKSPRQVSRYLKKFEIPTRAFSTKGLKPWQGKQHTEETKKKISKSHAGKKLSSEHRKKVIKTLSSVSGQTKDKNPQWKGGRIKVTQGYIWIRMPKHPNAYKNGYVPEHRLIASQKIGRPLTRYEHVHHLNGIKDDNRPDNLEVLNGQTHNLITRLEQRIQELERENEQLNNKLERTK